MPVTCPHCQTYFPKSDNINSRHKATCAGWQVLLGDVKPRPCICGHESTSLTQMKRHRSQCAVWTDRDRGVVQMSRLADTLQSRYGEGVTHPMDVPGAQGKHQATNFERYGAENVFSRQSILFNQIQEAAAPHRPIMYGEDNPFSWPDVQAKIRETNLTKYGVENPQQAPEIRAHTHATNLERYGTEETLASPIIREKIIATNQERYGGPSPSCSPEVNERASQTNLERWGVPWTSMHPVVRQKQYDAMTVKYGTHFLASEEGRRRIRAIFMAEYGVPHPMMVPEIALKALTNAGSRRGPNLPERIIGSLAPMLLYTGNGGFWRWLPKIGHHKNPDFILPGPDPEHPKKDVQKVVEHLGDWYHSRIFTGKSNFDHEQELVEAYQGIDIECLILWEHDVIKNPELVKEKINRFIDP